MKRRRFPLPSHGGLPQSVKDRELELAIFCANSWTEIAQRIRQSNLRLAIRQALAIAEGSNT